MHADEILKELHPICGEFEYERPTHSNRKRKIGSGDFEPSISAFSRAIEFKPDYAPAYQNRANAYV